MTTLNINWENNISNKIENPLNPKGGEYFSLTNSLHGNILGGESNFNKLISMLKSYFLSKEKLSVPEFKTLTHLTRKTAIPLLEYLDKSGFTFREENERIKGDRL